MGYLWENFWKTRKRVQKTMSADKLISIWEHHGQVFIFKHEEEAWVYKTVLGIFDFFFFRFQDMARNISCSLNWAFFFFGSKPINKWEGDGILKNPKHCFGNKVLIWLIDDWLMIDVQLCQVWALSSYPFLQFGLLESWFVITHTIWTTQEDTVFISDRTGTVVNV